MGLVFISHCKLFFHTTLFWSFTNSLWVLHKSAPHCRKGKGMEAGMQWGLMAGCPLVGAPLRVSAAPFWGVGFIIAGMPRVHGYVWGVWKQMLGRSCRVSWNRKQVGGVMWKWAWEQIGILKGMCTLRRSPGFILEVRESHQRDLSRAVTELALSVYKERKVCFAFKGHVSHLKSPWCSFGLCSWCCSLKCKV